MQSLYRFLRSIKLAVALILIIAALSILSTLIPQGEDAAFYFHTYGAFWAQVILRLRFHDFFHSFLFLAPVILFFVNLSVCTLDRLLSRQRRGARRRHGPDLIHIGLLLLIVGALVSVFGRREGMAYMGEGDEIRLPGEYTVRLLSYEFQQYEDGRPKDWISTVEVRRAGEVVVSSYPIEVNKPLRIGGIRVYQISFAHQDRAFLRDGRGQRQFISSGEGFEWQGGVVIFRGIEGQTAVFEKWEGHSRTAVYRVAAGEQVGEYSIEELGSREVTGLKAVKDPGFALVVVALIIAAGGLTVTLAQKGKDKQI